MRLTEDDMGWGGTELVLGEDSGDHTLRRAKGEDKKKKENKKREGVTCCTSS